MSIYEHIDKLKELKSNLKQEFLKKGVDLSNVEFTKYHEHISSLGNSLQLYPVNIYRDATNLIIQDENNGMFCTEYEIYDNGERVAKTKNKTYPINNLNVGEHNFSVVATGVNFIASEPSNPFYYPVFNYVKNLTGLYSSYNSNAGMYQTITDYLSVVDGNFLPRDISVTVGGEVAEYVYNCYTGELIISNITGEVEIVASSCSYPILQKPTINIVNNTISWKRVESATSYKVYSYGKFVFETDKTNANLREYLEPEKTYEISVTAVAENFQESALSESVIVEVENFAPIYGVSGLFDTTKTELTRTYDPQGLNYYYNSSSGEIVSDFDNVFPFNEMVKEKEGNYFVKIPKMYFKIETDANSNLTGVAVSKEPRAEGVWYESKEFYTGAYLSSEQNRVMYSLPNQAICTSLGLPEAINYSMENGENFSVQNSRQIFVVYLLALIEFGTKNLSYFITKDSSLTTGSTDSIMSASGYNLESGNFKYRHIEDFIGGNQIFIYGYIIVNGWLKIRVSYGNYQPIKDEYLDSENKWIGGLKWVEAYPFTLIPCNFNNNKLNTYYSRCTVGVSGESNLVFGGKYSQNAGAIEIKSIININQSKDVATRMIWEEGINDI